VKFKGENAANYENPEYDRLFERMKAHGERPARQALIDRMMAILQQDAPWSFGFHPKDYAASRLGAQPQAGAMVRNT
jgi:oligopeptide transport system substrate-binding protein